jgi:hypothetical protein
MVENLGDNPILNKSNSISFFFFNIYYTIVLVISGTNIQVSIFHDHTLILLNSLHFEIVQQMQF